MLQPPDERQTLGEKIDRVADARRKSEVRDNDAKGLFLFCSRRPCFHLFPFSYYFVGFFRVHEPIMVKIVYRISSVNF